MSDNEAQSLLVDAIMSRDVRSLTAKSTVEHALNVMHDFDIRHVPVVDDEGQLVGIVSDRDLREYTVPTLVRVRDSSQHTALMETPLDELMRVGIVCVEPEEPLRAAISVMLEYRVGALPVVTRGTKTLCGILSYVDVLKLAMDLLE